MTLQDLHTKVQEHLYIEDTGVIDAVIATVIANRLKIGDPVWMMVVGASSGGKSQILRPISSTDKKFLHRVDDITENTFLSGSLAKGGKNVSLLNRVGPHGMITISDLTVLFSRNAESRNAILSQLRMLYDGEMTKMVGNQDKPLVWKGYLGIIAGGTPSIYAGFEEVADMGERFLCYRMKNYDERKATGIALRRLISGERLDDELSGAYAEYIQETVMGVKDLPALSDEDIESITSIAITAEKLRTINRIDRFTKDLERIPVTALPMRTALQLSCIARANIIMKGHIDVDMLRWIGFSLANEEKRIVLKTLAAYTEVTTQGVADVIGLSTKITGTVLQNLASTGLVVRTGDSNSLRWAIGDEAREFVTDILPGTIVDRELSFEEMF